MAWLGLERLGMAWSGLEGQGVAGHGWPRKGMARLGGGKAMCGGEGCGKARKGKDLFMFDGYYTTTHWRKRRLEIIERDGHRCRGCNRHESEMDIQVHHRHYENPYAEKDEDLITVCIECHDALTNVRRTVRHNESVSPEHEVVSAPQSRMEDSIDGRPLEPAPVAEPLNKKETRLWH